MPGPRKSVEEEFIEYNIPTVDENGNEISKNARKKLLTKAKKDQRKANDAKKRQQETKKKQENAKDTSEGKYGIKELIQSKERTNRKFVDLSDLSSANDGETVLFRARVHNLRPQAKMVFIVLRQRFFTIQGVCLKQNCSPQMLKFIEKISSESVVDVSGKLLNQNLKLKVHHKVILKFKLKNVLLYLHLFLNYHY